MTSKVNSNKAPIRFLYSYGGRIVFRLSDGKLRYVGGHTRALSVDRSISYSELMAKFEEAYGSSVILKCNLPSEDSDVLITIKSEEELRSVIEEYEIAATEVKIRAFLFPMKKISQPSSPMSCFDFPSVPKHHPKSSSIHRCVHQATGYPVTAIKYYHYIARKTVPRWNQ